MHISVPSRPGSTLKLVKAGIVGLGTRAHLFAHAAVKSDKLKVVAGFSRSAEERRAFQLDTRVPVVSDLKTLLSYPMLDGIILAVPADEQLAVATQVAKAKKHMFIAGAVGSTLEQACEIAGLEQKYGVAVTAGNFARLLGGIAKIREAIAKGKVGTLALIEANYSRPSGVRGNSDLDGPERGASSDRVCDMAVQQFDILEYLGGEIAEVSAMVSSGLPKEPEALNECTTLLKFADGKLGYVGSSRSSPGVFAVRVFGTKGVMHYEADLDAWNTPEKLHETSTLYLQRTGYAKRENLPIPPTDASVAQLGILAEACRTGKSGEFSAARAISALAVFHAALRSLDNRGQTVRVHLGNHFVEGLRPRLTAS